MKLTDTQLIILGEASSRDDGIIVLPNRLKGGSATKIISALLKANLVEEIKAPAKAAVWRRDCPSSDHLAQLGTSISGELGSSAG